MTPRQIEVVQATWQKVVPISVEAAGLLFRRLFEIDPSLRALFKSDQTEQGRKVVAVIDLAVSRLDRLHEILPAVQALGRRHAGYGVEPRHYDAVGSALLWALKHGLGTAFTPEAKEAWTAAYATLAGAMEAAACETASA